MRFGPDAARYWLAGQGRPVARPFHLRWLLPQLCKTDLRRWWAVWAVSWPVLFASVWWLASGLGWQRAVLAAVLTVALPGVWGPAVVRPVGVDLPAMALGALAAAGAVHGLWWVVLPAVYVAASIKETAPVWAALWAWNVYPLVGLIVPLFVAMSMRPEMDEVTAQPALRDIHDHPIRTALKAREWRDGWVMVAPWGVCLAGLYAPSWPLVVVLVVAYAQLLVATDTVRLVHTAAGPALAVAATQVLPVPWLLVAAVAHVWWFRRPEVI